MRRRPVRFFSEQLMLDGDLYLPDDASSARRCPAVITTSGYQGLKDIHPARFARYLVDAGYVCLAFDYRGFGASEGHRGRLVPQEQVEDVQAAISLLETLPEVDPSAIALVGWALGGGVAIAAAADDARVKGVATVNAVAHGGRSTRALHDDESWAELIRRIADDRHRRVCGSRSELVDPFVVLPLDEVTERYVNHELRKAAGFGIDVTVQSAESLMRFAPELVVDRIGPRPLLLIHARDNGLYAAEESERLFARAHDPKSLVLLDNCGHTEWMFDEHPTFQHVARLVRSFLDELFSSSVGTSSESSSVTSAA